MLQCAVLLMVFFNDTATTEIYTYGHTLSLHSALPIAELCMSTTAAAASSTPAIPREARSKNAEPASVRRTVRAERLSNRTPSSCRSEEHTSELQSLMRISSAVFGLKNKTNPSLVAYLNPTTTQPTVQSLLDNIH